MKAADGPLPGWYPDPEGGVRLRWWDGTDWTERYRARPSPGAGVGAPAAGRSAGTDAVRTAVGSARRETEDLVAQVRQAARAEVDRAADVFSARARAATREIEPLISRYTSRAARWLKIGALAAGVLVIGWFVFEAVAQATFLDWIGDRIDAVTDR